MQKCLTNFIQLQYYSIWYSDLAHLWGGRDWKNDPPYCLKVYLLPLHVDDAVLAPVLEAVPVGGHTL